MGGDLTARAPAWFGPTSWTVIPASLDPDTEERRGFSTATIAHVRRSDDGTCLVAAGTAFRQARYESVGRSIRIAFVTRRCQGATTKAR